MIELIFFSGIEEYFFCVGITLGTWSHSFEFCSEVVKGDNQFFNKFLIWGEGRIKFIINHLRESIISGSWRFWKTGWNFQVTRFYLESWIFFSILIIFFICRKLVKLPSKMMFRRELNSKKEWSIESESERKVPLKNLQMSKNKEMRIKGGSGLKVSSGRSRLVGMAIFWLNSLEQFAVRICDDSQHVLWYDRSDHASNMKNSVRFGLPSSIIICRFICILKR